jgi:hypothetical protein
MAPRWGWDGVVGRVAFPRWGWEGAVRLTGSSRGAGKAWFVARTLLFGLEVSPTDGTFFKFARRAMT